MDAGSEDNLSWSENEASDNADSEEESDGEEAYGSHDDTLNYNQSDDDSGNETERVPKPSPPRTRSRTQGGT